MGLFSEVQVFDPIEQYNATPFTPKPYDVSQTVINQHGVFRFGHSNDFQDLVSGLTGSSDTSTDYIVGVVAAAMLIFLFALVWSMVIVGLKIAGQKKVGFLAGRLEDPDYRTADHVAEDEGTLPVIQEEPGIQEEPEIESLLDSDMSSPLIICDNIDRDLQRVKREKKFNRKVWAVRGIFVLSGIGVIVFGALFYSKGVTAFQRSLDSVHGGLELVQQTAHQAINLTDTLINDKEKLSSDFNKTKEETGGAFCNGDGAVAATIRDNIQELLSEITDLSSMVEDSLSTFGNDLRELIAITEDVDNMLSTADILFYFAISISIIIGMLIISMLLVTYFSTKGVSNCCTKFATNAILWPIFIFFLVLFWILSLLFLVTSLAGSDFCVKPDEIVEGLLYQYKELFHSVMFDYLIYYVSGCSVIPDSEGKIDAMGEELGQVMGTVNGFAEIVMGASLEELESQCGLENAAASALKGGAELFNEASHAMNGAWIQFRHILECKTFNPIYTTFVHDAVCVEGVGGLTWLFSTAFCLTLFAMIMIMFRAALYPVKRSPAQAQVLGLDPSLLGKSGD
ncbi:hypothetical protein ACHAXR_010807 [Thalassiosira sp. AJA248-18]